MKFSCKTENLKKGLQLVSRIVGKNQSLPILNNVLLQTKDGLLKLSTTNLEIGIQTTIRGKVDKEGEMTIPAKLFSEYVNNVSSETIELETQKTNLKLSSKGSKTTIKGLDAAEFPLLPEIDPEIRFDIDVSVFKKALQQTVLASANDTSRPELCNVLLKIENKTLTFAATDSYRLAEKKIIIEQDINTTVLIPQTTLQEVNRIFDENDEESVLIEMTDNQIKFSTTSRFLISRLTEGQFPDYQQIIPTNNKTQCVVNVAVFSKSIRAASIFCRQGIDDIKLEFSNNKIVIKAINDKIGDSVIELDAEVVGDDNSIVFNYHYLLDVLGVVDSSEIDLGLTEANLPGIIRPHGDDSYTYVIMPIRQ